MGEFMAPGAARSETDRLAERVAGGTAPRLGHARESGRYRLRVGDVASECATRAPVWGGGVGPPDGQALWNGIDVTAPRQAEGNLRKDSRLLLVPGLA